MDKDPLPTQPDSVPGFGQKTSFLIRSSGLRTLRLFKDAASDVNCLPKTEARQFPFVLAESITPLRTTSAPEERVFSRGKIENLRQACRRLNGTLLQPGEVFSFWKQVGAPWKSRGFVVGREIRQGCVIPSAGGGLCQISGALFEAANSAGLKIVERHKHTHRLPDVEYVAERDATVFWNYVDLRFQAPSDHPVAIEAWMSPDELIVRFRAPNPVRQLISRDRSQSCETQTQDGLDASGVHNCFSCGKVECSRHEKAQALLAMSDPHLKTAALLDTYVPEFETYLSGELIDFYLLPAKAPGLNSYRWHIPGSSRVRTAWSAALKRAFYTRWATKRGQIAAETRLKTAEWLAKEYAKLLPYDIERLIVSQDFLPFLWKEGALQGRSFDVLMTRPALSMVHNRLDEARGLLPHASELAEYRAPQWVIEAESEALVYASKVITPHEEYANHYPNLRKLEWTKPQVEPPPGVRKPGYLLFPASLAAREGAHAALAASEELGVPLLVVGRDLEGLSVESDLVEFTTPGEIPWHEIAAVLHPTLFESWPRLHLRALALGIPVIATEAVGLEEGSGVSFVPFGDELETIRVLERALSREIDSLREPHALPRHSAKLELPSAAAVEAKEIQQ